MASSCMQSYPIPTNFPEVLHDLIRENLRH